ncbi:hypothetical protein, partial [Rugamonas violacea]|uniref:hypothetical protein n=1 Tax=Rugamonas sp. CCM 8940 TaxID=2765359 RepID=UPI001F488D74
PAAGHGTAPRRAAGISTTVDLFNSAIADEPENCGLSRKGARTTTAGARGTSSQPASQLAN